MAIVREPAVAGLFYPGDAYVLQHSLNEMLNKVPVTDLEPRAIIAPHAGYIYSGEVAASAYKLLEPMKNKIHRVVLLGPAHRVAVSGCALSRAEYFRTPLGDIPIDTEAVQNLLQNSNVQLSDLAHQEEHSLEVQLPFLQTVLHEFCLVPVVVGQMEAGAIMDVLELFWEDPATLFVVSSDLSHFHDYLSAQKIDRQTTSAIEQLKFDYISGEMACGAYPVNGLLKLAKKHHLQCQTLDLRNSGDTAGDKSRVVGYGAYAFY
ncbi:MAG TPA: AmmeMemoRadiSam system protein B [Gammaproteobacteria bacterium]|nr:AmmeMemoRadiSam system protein B [Gammaproteobacteria bacterium]